MTDLAAVIITKNEARRIQRCLDSIRWIPEIIIVDDQSCDETVEICRRYTDKIITHPLSGDFAAQRNIGTQAATRQWVLQLDADEKITEQARRVIEKELCQGKAAAAFSLIRQNYFLGRRMRFGGWNERSVKLFKRENGRYEGKVHESLRVNGCVQNLNAAIEHYPFDSFSDCLEKLNRYTSLEAQMMAERNPSVSRKEFRYQVMWRPLKLFWKIYVKKQGFREGLSGFIFASFWALGHFMKWTKYWELTGKCDWD